MDLTSDEHYMDLALMEAQKAELAGEVPVGAVIVSGNEVIGRGFNVPIFQNDPTAHAEIIAIRQAAQAERNYRLTNATLYCTVEPCMMCAGAMIHARLMRLVFGTPGFYRSRDGWLHIQRPDGSPPQSPRSGRFRHSRR